MNTILVFYRGDFEWYLGIQIARGAKVTYKQVADFFIKQFNNENQQKISIDSVKVFQTTPDINDDFLITNLNTLLPDYPQTYSDIIIQPKDYNPPAPKNVIDNKHAILFVEQARKFIQKEDYTTALTFLYTADEVGFYELVNLFYKIKNWEQLSHYLNKMSIMYPTDERIAIIRGYCLLHLHRDADASKVFKEAIQFSRHPEVTMGCAVSCIKGEEGSLSQLMLKTTLLSDSFSPFILKKCAYLLRHYHEYKHSIEVLLRHPSCYRSLGKSCKIPEVSSALFEKLQSLNLTPKVLVSFANVLYESSATFEAMVLYRQAASKSDLNPKIIIPYIHALICEGKFCILYEVVIGFFERYHSTIVVTLKLGDLEHVFKNLSMAHGYEWFNSKKPARVYIDENETDLPEYNTAILVCLGLFASAAFLDGYTSDAIFVLSHLSKFNAKTPYDYCYPLINSCCKAIIYEGHIYSASYRLLGLGDESIVYTTNILLTDSSNNAYAVAAMPFTGLSIYDLRHNHKSGAKQVFWDKIERLDIYDGLILCLGQKDCEEVIPQLQRNGLFRSVKDAITMIANTYLGVIKKIKIRFPKTTVYIHPIIAKERATAPLVHALNEELQRRAAVARAIFLPVFGTAPPENLLTLHVEDGDLSINYEEQLQMAFLEAKTPTKKEASDDEVE